MSNQRFGCRQLQDRAADVLLPHLSGRRPPDSYRTWIWRPSKKGSQLLQTATLLGIDKLVRSLRSVIISKDPASRPPGDSREILRFVQGRWPGSFAKQAVRAGSRW